MREYRQRPEAKKRLRQRQQREHDRERNWRINPTQLPSKRQQAFWARVNKRGRCAGRLSYCWFWTGKQNRQGYGIYGSMLAHRVAWALTYSVPVSDGLMLDHLCDTPICVRPSHCREATAAENNARSRALRSKSTHCKNGHLWTPKNTYITPGTGYRQCIKCSRQAKKTQATQRRQRAGCAKNHQHSTRKRVVGTKRVLPTGDMLIYDPEHPIANCRGEVLEHRKVWYDARGPIPKGHVIHHKDENKLNNQIENLEALSRAAHNTHHQTKKTHCSREHERTPENTYIYPNGSRCCRACNRERDRQRIRTKTAA